MNRHQNARLSLVRRTDRVRSIDERGLTPAEAAAEVGISAPVGRKCLGRYPAWGVIALKASRVFGTGLRALR